MLLDNLYLFTTFLFQRGKGNSLICRSSVLDVCHRAVDVCWMITSPFISGENIKNEWLTQSFVVSTQSDSSQRCLPLVSCRSVLEKLIPGFISSVCVWSSNRILKQIQDKDSLKFCHQCPGALETVSTLFLKQYFKKIILTSSSIFSCSISVVCC